MLTEQNPSGNNLGNNDSNLREAVREGNSGWVKRFLDQGADPNFISPDCPTSPFHEALLSGNHDVVMVFLSHKKKRADINIVGHEFKSCVRLVKDSDSITVDEKVKLIDTLISKRDVIDKETLKEYVNTCSMLLSVRDSRTILAEDDFALLCHYVSRLCGIDVGEILNRDNNRLRYNAHLCDYTVAKIQERDIMGWEPLDFLSLRIFSLFEILVKIKKGIIKDGTDDRWAELLKEEVLVEVETLKTENERRVISGLQRQGASKNQQKSLFQTLAKTIVDRVTQYPEREFSLAAGYRHEKGGHTIYVSLKGLDGLKVRFDNIGKGATERHKRDGEGNLLPLLGTVPKSSQAQLVPYVVRVFTSLSICLKLERMERTKSEEEKQKIISLLYDDGKYGAEKLLNYDVVDANAPILSEQKGRSCTAMSHQAGMLCRLADESLENAPQYYHWILMEEFHCIFEYERNSGAAKARDSKFWDRRAIEHSFPKHADCLDLFHIVQAFFKYSCIKKFINDDELYVRFIKEFEQSDFMKLRDFLAWFQQQDLAGKPYHKVLWGLICIKLANREKKPLNKYQLFDRAQLLFREISQSHLSNELNVILDKFFDCFIKCFRGLCLFNLNRVEEARACFDPLATQTVRAEINGTIDSLNSGGLGIIAGLKSALENSLVIQGALYLYGTRGVAYSYLEQDEFVQAEPLFQDGCNFARTVQPALKLLTQKNLFDPAPLAFGLIVINVHLDRIQGRHLGNKTYVEYVEVCETIVSESGNVFFGDKVNRLLEERAFAMSGEEAMADLVEEGDPAPTLLLQYPAQQGVQRERVAAEPPEKKARKGDSP